MQFIVVFNGFQIPKSECLLQTCLKIFIILIFRYINYVQMLFDCLVFHRIIYFALEKRSSVVNIFLSESNNIASCFLEYRQFLFIEKKIFRV